MLDDFTTQIQCEEIYDEAIKKLIAFQEEIVKEVGKEKRVIELFLRFFPIRIQHSITKLTKSITGFVKIIILKMLPKKISSKIMSKWASINGRKYVEENAEDK